MNELKFNQILVSNSIKDISPEVGNIFQQIRRISEQKFYDTTRLKNFI